MNLRIGVLDKGWVELDGYMVRASTGERYSDWDAARFARESTTADLKGEEKDLRLLDRLLRGDDGGPAHVSPLDHHRVCFRMHLPIFVMRQMVRHWSLRFNEYSGRYSEMTADYYSTGVNAIDQSNRLANDLYRDAISDEVERETARLVIPLAQYTRISVSGSLRDWLFAFLRQRLHWHSQAETREYAYVVAAYIRELYPAIWELFWTKSLCVQSTSVFGRWPDRRDERLAENWAMVERQINSAGEQIRGRK